MLAKGSLCFECCIFTTKLMKEIKNITFRKKILLCQIQMQILCMPFYPGNLLFENLFPHLESHYCKHLETHDIHLPNFLGLAITLPNKVSLHPSNTLGTQWSTWQHEHQISGMMSQCMSMISEIFFSTCCLQGPPQCLGYGAASQGMRLSRMKSLS